MLYARQWCACPDDALQDALIDLNHQVLVPHDPVAWLFTTVRCKAINQARSEQRRSKYHRQIAEQRDRWFSTEPSSELESKELEEMLTELGPLEREIVVARIWGEMTFEQIAKLVGRSLSAVHRSYQRALDTLGKRLDGQTEPLKKLSKFI